MHIIKVCILLKVMHTLKEGKGVKKKRTYKHIVILIINELFPLCLLNT